MPDPVMRANVTYLAMVGLLVFAGIPLTRAFKMGGVVAGELVLFLALPVALLVVEGQPLPAALRLRPVRLPNVIRLLGVGAIAWGVAACISVAWIYLLQHVGQVPRFNPFGTLGTAREVLFALAVGALLPAVCEEVAFRGYFLHQYRHLGPRMAVLLTALVFGAVHLTLLRLPALLFVGAVVTVAVQRTGSLLSGVLLHGMNNALSILSAAAVFRLRGAPSPELAMGAIPLPALAAVLAIAALGLLGLRDLLRSLDGGAQTAPAARNPSWQSWLPLAGAAALYAWAVWWLEMTAFLGR